MKNVVPSFLSRMVEGAGSAAWAGTTMCAPSVPSIENPGKVDFIRQAAKIVGRTGCKTPARIHAHNKEIMPKKRSGNE